MTDTPTRLNKLLALQLGISRREADLLIEKGNVLVNGKPIILGAQITATDTITVNGTPVAAHKKPYTYLALNKPVGYVCSRRAQGDSPTIYSIIPEKYHELKPVGRLDRNSSGLILLTNDGDFTYRMTHPKFVKTKVYHVRIDHDLQPLHQQMISDFGIQLDDGRSQLLLQRRYDDKSDEWIVTMSEGRNRQIRRTFMALGYTVERLHRVQFGNYTIGDMKPGELVPVTMQ